MRWRDTGDVIDLTQAEDEALSRKGCYGATPMPVEVLRELQQRLPDVRFWNFYGQTELAPLATILRPHEQVPHAAGAGRAALNVETITFAFRMFG